MTEYTYVHVNVTYVPPSAHSCLTISFSFLYFKFYFSSHISFHAVKTFPNLVWIAEVSFLSGIIKRQNTITFISCTCTSRTNSTHLSLIHIHILNILHTHIHTLVFLSYFISFVEEAAKGPTGKHLGSI